MLERGALPDDEVVRLLGRFVTIRIDVSTSSELAERFGARVLPTLCLISPDGKIRRLEGTISAKELASALREVSMVK